MLTPLAYMLTITWMIKQILLQLRPAMATRPGCYQYKWYGGHDGQKSAYHAQNQGYDRKNAPEYGLGLLEHGTSKNGRQLQDTMPDEESPSLPAYGAGDCGW